MDGARVRKAVLRDDAVIELGRSFFVIRQAPLSCALPVHLAADVDAEHLPVWPDGMATLSPSLASEFESMIRIASHPWISLVLRGETGTGKEVIARAQHQLSMRPGAFIAVNCGAIPPSLVEAELFGHRRGAFSGAVAERPGLVRSADRGTLFLDEVGELPLSSQAALLRVLQEREVLPVGADRPTRVDLCVIAATLRDLEAEVEAGRFRADLYARLAGHLVTLPPLRDRREDLGLLISTILRKVAGPGVRIAPAALCALLQYRWPNNVRELEQALTAATALAVGDEVTLRDLPAVVTSQRDRRSPVIADQSQAPLAPRDRALRERLIALFTEHDGNVVAVANALGKRRAQIYRWIKRYAIDLTPFRRRS